MNTSTTHCAEYAQVDRRTFLTRSLQAAGGLLFGNRLVALPRWMPSLQFAAPHVGPRGDTLVCIFLRGGADGLNIVVPHGDEAYYALRPTISLARPDARQSSGRAVDLDGFFGLHPALDPLTAIYQTGDLALVQATGSPDETRSHFEAMGLMERGATSNGDYTGWLARHLATLDTGNESALRAIGLGEMLPASLSGAVSATALQSIADYHLRGADERVGEIQAFLQALYSEREGLWPATGLTAVAQQTFAAIEVLNRLNLNATVPNGRPYPETDFGQALQTIAQLITADVGLEAACLDVGGWDTHVAQGGAAGLMANQLGELAAGLAAFYEDLQARMSHITMVVMSEFGRRARENAGLGTDHGHGNMMMVLGGGINGRRVYANWPGLHPDQLVGPGDLAVTIDYRDVLGELIHKRLNNPQAAAVFPGYTIHEQGIAQPRLM